MKAITRHSRCIHHSQELSDFTYSQIISNQINYFSHVNRINRSFYISLINFENIHNDERNEVQLHENNHFLPSNLMVSTLKSSIQFPNLSRGIEELNLNIESMKDLNEYNSRFVLKELILKYNLNSNEIAYLSKELSLPKQYFISLQQRTKHISRHGRIIKNKEIRKKITDWLQNNNIESVSDLKIKELANILNVSIISLKRYIYYCNQIPGVITDESKNILKKWLENNANARPSKYQLSLLCNETGLAKFQIFNLISYFKANQPGKVTPKVKEIIKAWVQKHERSPNSQERKDLEKETGLNAYQVRRCIQVALGSQKSISPKAKEIIKKWKLENNWRKPNEIERVELQEITGLSSYQLSMLLSIKPPRHFLKERFNQLEEWINSNINNIEKDIDSNINIASKTFGLDKNSVKEQIKKKIGSSNKIKITENSKSILSNWVLNNNNSPTKTQKLILQQQTGLNLSQIISQIKYLRKTMAKQNNSINLVN